MKIESTAFERSDVEGFIDEMAGREKDILTDRLEAATRRLRDLAPRMEKASPPAGEEWSAKEILAHIAVLSKFYGMVSYKVGTGAMPKFELLQNVKLRDVMSEQLSALGVEELVEMACVDHARTLTWLRQASVKDMRRTTLVDGQDEFRCEDLIRIPLVSHLEAHLDQLEALLPTG